ncbi:MAG TPA: DMT family transporter [Burkholderiales bacterium]|nr:DMT family transporter [Burkholderiales bacterium]
MNTTRAAAFGLLALANLMWSGNWILGRALRETFDPIALNFWRWLIALLVLAPFAVREAVAKRAIIRRHAGLLGFLALAGVVAFQGLVYLGLESTTAINAVLINASAPAFIVICSWAVDRQRAGWRQLGGMLISFLGVLVIVCQGEPARLLQLEIHRGDAWILLAMPIWGIYSVLVKRCPPELRGVALTFVLAAIGVAMLLPLYFASAARGPLRWPTQAEAGAVLYVAVAASVLAFLCWNRGVSVVGANAAGFTLPLLPAFGTVLALIFLGEAFRGFHAAGFAILLVGVVLATYRSR